MLLWNLNELGYIQAVIRRKLIFNVMGENMNAKMQLQIEESREYFKKMSEIVRNATVGELHPEIIKGADIKELINNITNKNREYDIPINLKYASADKLSQVSRTSIGHRQGRFMNDRKYGKYILKICLSASSKLFFYSSYFSDEACSGPTFCYKAPHTEKSQHP